MDRVPVVDLQTPWDCRWTRLAQPLAGRHARAAQDVLWVCVRGGGRRYVSDEECETCEFWQPHATD
jgi:hypothetical protein